IETAFIGLKPWTRIECAQLLEQADEAVERDEGAGVGLAELRSRLQEEFAYESGLLEGKRNATARLESIYARGVSVSGPALTDGDHFGQTSPYAPPLSDPIRNFIATRDMVPVPAGTAFTPIDRPRLLDAYIAVNVKEGWQLSFGNQSLSWGPGPGGSFLFSDNIEP